MILRPAIQCDVTRVVGIQLMDSNGKPIYMPTPIPATAADYAALNYGNFGEYHTIAHTAGDPKVQCDRFFLSFLARLSILAGMGLADNTFGDLKGARSGFAQALG